MNGGAATNTLRLGRFMKEYRVSAGGVAKLIIIAAICAGIAALFFVGAVSEASSHEFGGMVALSILGLVFLAISIFGIYMLFRSGGASLRLYENGLSFRRAGKEASTTWAEIDSYMQEMACRIVKKDGEVIEFGSGLKDADEVAQKIQDETLKIMLPQVNAALGSGSRVEFKGWQPADKVPLGRGLSNYMEAGSGFAVDSYGITENDTGKCIAWTDVTDFGISEETRGPRLKIPIRVLYIADTNQRFRTRYGLLANAHLLLRLCRELSGHATS
jgi:hypothetical protein